MFLAAEPCFWNKMFHFYRWVKRTAILWNKVLTVVVMKIQIFWKVMLYWQVNEGHSICQGNLLSGAKNVACEKWSIHSWKYVASSCKYHHLIGVYVEEPLVGSKLSTSLESRICYFIVVHTGNMEQKIQHKWIAQTLNKLPSSSRMFMVHCQL
jgi:hypothetical protein